MALYKTIKDLKPIQYDTEDEELIDDEDLPFTVEWIRDNLDSDDYVSNLEVEMQNYHPESKSGESYKSLLQNYRDLEAQIDVLAKKVRRLPVLNLPAAHLFQSIT